MCLSPSLDGRLGVLGLAISNSFGEQVFVLANGTLELEVTDGGCIGCEDIVIFQGPKGGLPGAAYALNGNTSFSISPGDLPLEIPQSGYGNVVLYRARRSRVSLSDGREMLLVSGRSVDWNARYLEPGIGLLTTPEPVEYGALAFPVDITGATFPDGTLMLVNGSEAAFELSSDTTGSVFLSDTFGFTGTVSLTANDPTGQFIAEGALEVVPPVLTCDLTEFEPNGLLSQAHFFNPGIVACGSLDPAGDSDHYRFNASAGSTYTFETWAGRLGEPTDTMLQLLNSSGTVLLEDDDGAGSLDSLLNWTAPSGGQFFVRVLPYNTTGGPGNDYQLTTSVFP